MTTALDAPGGPSPEEPTYLLLGFASRFVDWVLVLLGLPSILLLVLFGRLTTNTSHIGHKCQARNTQTRFDGAADDPG